MEAKTSTEGADKAINKFGTASIILATCLGLAALIPAIAFSLSIL